MTSRSGVGVGSRYEGEVSGGSGQVPRVLLKHVATCRYSLAIMVLRLAPSRLAVPWIGVLRRNLAFLVRRRSVARDRWVLGGLLCVVVGIGAGAAELSSAWFPPSSLVLPVLAGGLVLRVRSLAVVLAAVAGALGYDVLRLGPGSVGPGLVATLVVTAGLAVLMARMREKIGVAGLRGEQMLLELRDQLRAQGQLPPLPAGWGAQLELGQAGGSSFGGDFVVSTLSGGGNLLEVAMVDVSGKGIDAGTRALLLSGAAGGLLGSVPRDRFLPATNDYLLRQRWEEGFATAVHLALDLRTGSYVVASAGHPPPVQFDAGSGTWRVAAGADGPAAGPGHGVVLGVLPEVSYAPAKGTLRRGDALLLYTDGLVETRERDIDLGVDRLLGGAERLVTRGFRDGAGELVSELSSRNYDDCALVVIWRT